MKKIITVLKNRKKAIDNAKEKLAFVKLLQKSYEDDDCYRIETEQAIEAAEEEIKELKKYSAIQVILYMLRHPMISDQ